MRSIRRITRPLSPRNSCSQMRSTLQPRLLSDLSTRLSRRRFRRIFVVQNEVLVLGTVPCRRQPCQKHPLTNIATLKRRSTMSGFPGSPRVSASVDCIPARRSTARKASSGAVPNRLTRPIRRLRSGVGGRITAVGFLLTSASRGSRQGGLRWPTPRGTRGTTHGLPGSAFHSARRAR
jgi:hypothetical protein